MSIAAKLVTVRKGKGGHARIVRLADEACRIVARHIAVGGLTSGPLLRDRRFPSRGIQPQTVGTLVQRLAERAGVKMRAHDGVGPQSLRHTCASDIYAACRDVLAVRDLLGHVELGTTARYVRGLDLDRLREVVEGRTYLPDAPADSGTIVFS